MSAGAILPSRHQVLGLYKNLLRYGNQVKLTDKNYILTRIRREFRQNIKLTENKAIIFSYQKGTTLLKNNKIV